MYKTIKIILNITIFKIINLKMFIIYKLLSWRNCSADLIRGMVSPIGSAILIN